MRTGKHHIAYILFAAAAALFLTRSAAEAGAFPETGAAETASKNGPAGTSPITNPAETASKNGPAGAASETGASENCPAESTMPQEDMTGLIVLFSPAFPREECGALLASLPDADIVWHENSAALINVPASEADRILGLLCASSCVSAADYDGEIELASISMDAYSNAQWGLNNTGSYSFISDMNTSTILSTPDIDMNIPEAWDSYQSLVSSPREVVVAVIDTGVDVNHPDLAANIWINRGEIPGDGIDNDNNGFVDDIYGWDFYNGDNTVCHYDKDGVHTLLTDNDDHGSHVAGIIAAVKDNGVGIAGVASCADVKIMVLKIHGGKNGSGTIANAVRAIRYATAMGADICNISWGTSRDNQALEQAIRESDMFFVAAAGNSGSNNDSSPVYPANYPLDNILSVTFIDASGRMSAKSNYGPSTVDIAAPGVHIFSTCVGGYVSLSGSSMAAPHAAGVAALLYSCGQHQYPANIKELLTGTAKPIAELEGKVKYAGIPDAAAALGAISGLRHDYYAPVLTFTPGFDKENLLLTVSASDKGGSGIRTVRYAAGVRELSSFRRGTAETAVTPDSPIALTKAGKYTFYVSDYAGNERIIVYQLEDDLLAPTAALSWQVSFLRDTMTVHVNASDHQSGLRLVQYAEGNHDTDYFRSGKAGTTVSMKNGSGSFHVKKEGLYTVYLSDYRGNKTVQTIEVQVIPSVSMSLNASSKTLAAGMTFQLIPSLNPAESTDKLKFSSSNPAVCKVNSAGMVTAIAPGKAVITAKTASGIEKKCTITVNAE
ncbi:MAG: S8 family serine peptidase [Lachnospiraceae bacterium]|nr:S8 family serine peptidase [Lachnospiraceae bacterium]